jgi:hypothetical protein
MDWLDFPPDVEAWADECARATESTETFEVIGGVTKTHGTGAVRVRMQSGRFAWAKPGRGGDNLRLVGREKLAAHLGFLLKLPVAPVQISRQTTEHRHILPTVVALSYETLASGRDWEDFRATQDEVDSLRSTFTALWVFHAWIAERDHRGAGWNLKGERLEQILINPAHILPR